MPIPLAYDVETTSNRRQIAELFSFSTCTEDGKVGIHRLDGSAVRISQNTRHLEYLWSDEGMKFAKVMHNGRFDLGMTEKHLKRKLRKHPIHDTFLMSHILRNDHPSHALDDLAWDLAGYSKSQDRAIKPYTKGKQSFKNVPESLFDPYQFADGERGMLLFLFFWEKIKNNPDWLEIYKSELAVIPVTIDMENRGVMIDRNRTHKLISKLEQDARDTLAEIKHETGHKLKPGTEKFRDYMYSPEGLNLPVGKKTATGKPKASKFEFAEFYEQFPNLKVLQLAMKYKSWSIGSSTLRGYLSHADSEDILHPNIRTCAAVTGRESVSDPALQTVQKTGVLLNPFPVPARTCFRPRPGYVNFHIDYSGQEMRLLVHYSGDKILVDVCNGVGEPRFNNDVHMPATLIFFGDVWDTLDKAQRKTKRNGVKNGNFAKAYGAQWIKIANTLDLEGSDAERKCRIYETTFPNLCRLMPTIMDQVRQQGFVTTQFGRRLYVPRNLAYTGVNYLIQGTAAEMLKRGQIRVHEYLESIGGELKLLLPIHDELIIECPRHLLGEAKEILKHVCFLMTDFPGRFRVPLTAEVSIAWYDWASKKEWMVYP